MADRKLKHALEAAGFQSIYAALKELKVRTEERDAAIQKAYRWAASSGALQAEVDMLKKKLEAYERVIELAVKGS